MLIFEQLWNVSRNSCNKELRLLGTFNQNIDRKNKIQNNDYASRKLNSLRCEVLRLIEKDEVILCKFFLFRDKLPTGREMHLKYFKLSDSWGSKLKNPLGVTFFLL